MIQSGQAADIPLQDPLVRIAALEGRIAQLEQRIVVLENQSKQLPAAPFPPPAGNEKLFEIVRVDGRVTEVTDSWSRFAWKLVVKSLSRVPLSFDATVQFLDTEGFLVAASRRYSLLLHPLGEEAFTDSELIDNSIVRNITQIKAEIRLA